MSAPGRLWEGRHLHLIGVGGAGMSAYARAAHALGARLSGSDAATGRYTEELAGAGVLEASIGHRAENLPAGTEAEVFYSSAVPADNAERAAARERGLRERPRAELLGELTALRRTIAVAGTHGKTTTAAMLVHALRGAGGDPGWLIGGAIGRGLTNAHWSEDPWLVVEADESDRSMLSIDAEIAVVTNVELDHHTTYASLEQVREVFRELLLRPRVAVVWDRPELLRLRAGPVVAFEAEQLELDGAGARLRWHGHPVRLAVPGAHNALNAVAALEAAALTGAEEDGAVAGIESFRGAERRFQELGSDAHGARVFEDYAHHPSEVRATLAAARTLASERLVAVFQPHLFSRTRLLAREFGAALALADAVAVLDVYPARERAEEHPGVSGLLVAEAAADAAAGRLVMWLPSRERAREAIAAELRRGDLCVVMGAGDVGSLARELVA